jgi:(1->4)-alpha-D-glucan 1-alpha-D-glucosylmutase
VDGLRDPLAYLERLRGALDGRAPHGAHVPVYVEKILTPGEPLRAEWPVDGTTGYEALNDIEAPFVDADGFGALEQAYRRTMRLKDHALGFGELAVRGKELVLRTAFRPEIRRAVRALVRVARAERADLPPPQLADAVLRLAAALPVYRTYVTAGRDGRVQASADDRAVLDHAVARALPRTAGDERAEAALRFVVDVLTGGRPGADAPPAAREAAAEFALRFQQTSGPATAKGVEDTALYRWTPLASLNEVGGEPDRDLAASVAALHAANAERAARWPRALVTVTTHDTKRTADARARLDALTAHADAWTRCVRVWRRRHAPLRPRVASARGVQGAPDANLAWLLYQAFACVWPAGVAEPDAPTRDRLAARLAAYAEKAAREAKTHTSWVDPEPEFERAVAAFVDALARGEAGARFRTELAGLLARVEPTARRITLARTALHLLGPGTPDVYQGDEHRLLALVDPDNRSAVDFAARAAALEEPGGEAADAEKLALLRAGLALRAAHAEAFATGGYVALEATGARAPAVVAFARVHGPWALLVAVERPATLAAGDGGWGRHGGTPPRVARRTRLAVGVRPRVASAQRPAPPAGAALPVAALLGEAPVGVLLSDAP